MVEATFKKEIQIIVSADFRKWENPNSALRFQVKLVVYQLTKKQTFP